MKLRSVLAALLAAAFLLLGGCSLFGLDIERPSDVYLQYDLSDAASEVAVDRGLHTVVSLVSIGNFSDKLTFGTIVKISSGVIVDREGYILSSDTALRPTFTDPEDGVTYTGTWTSVYAVLPEIYGLGNTLYPLRAIDLDEESGLSLFAFRDRFYYMDADGNAAEGFPVSAQISLSAEPGRACFIVGNGIGDVVNEVDFPYVAEYMYISMMSGTVASRDGAGDYIIAAPVTPELVGGAVLDENGYMIGLVSEKVQHTDESGNTVYAKNAVRAIGSQALTEYIDAVSARLQIAIPYTVAVLGGET